VTAPADYNIRIDRTAAACGVCHSRDAQHRVLVAGDLALDQAQYDQWIYSRHGIDTVDCVNCHNPHVTTAHDAEVADAGLIRGCLDCHVDGRSVSGAMASLSCNDCHVPLAMVSATVSGTGVHRRGDLHLHSLDIDATGIPLADFFETDGSVTWVHVDATERARVNLAWACMQCHDGTGLAHDITSFSEAALRAQGMHRN
jgi:hypothetical protein